MVQQIQQPIESYAPYAQGQTLVNSANFIETTANWCSCLQGQKPILRILDELANAMGAGLVLLSRVPKDPNMPSRALSSETRPDNYGSASARSFARNIMGGYLTGAKPGSVWVQSVVAPDHDEDLARFQRMRQFHELALIPLQTTDNPRDEGQKADGKGDACVDRAWNDFFRRHPRQRQNEYPDGGKDQKVGDAKVAHIAVAENQKQWGQNNQWRHAQ